MHQQVFARVLAGAGTIKLLHNPREGPMLLQDGAIDMVDVQRLTLAVAE
jgi:hypothetical protein